MKSAKSQSSEGHHPTLRTRSVQTTDLSNPEGEPLSQPIFQTSAFGFADSGLADDRFASGQAVYARDGLPNVRALERIVADLEGADDAVAVASGMAALSLTLFSLLQSGDHVILPSCCYRDTNVLIAEQFARFDISSTCVNPNDLDDVATAITQQTRLMLAETISNPGMTLTNLPPLAELLRTRGILLCVDNTFATPVLCRPLEHGADLVLHSVGKFLGGHHDLTAGIVVGPRDLISTLRRSAYLLGPTLAPMDAWLAVRGIKTLAPRMTWISSSAKQIASWLAAHPAIRTVRFPGLPTDEQRATTQRLLPHGQGGVMAFDLHGGESAADQFIRSLQSIPYAPTVGGSSTIVSYPPQPDSEATGSPPRRYRNATIRLSIGLEDPTDLIHDLSQALDTVVSDDITMLISGHHPLEVHA
jgi:cystathionine beta-lyase/cystathionine gamma-synthase